MNTIECNLSVDKAIQIAISECPDAYAQTYLRAANQAVEFGVEGLKIQLLYALNNMAYWKGPTARQVKKVLKKYAMAAPLDSFDIS
jgi:hypothetical protein